MMRFGQGIVQIEDGAGAACRGLAEAAGRTGEACAECAEGAKGAPAADLETLEAEAERTEVGIEAGLFDAEGRADAAAKGLDGAALFERALQGGQAAVDRIDQGAGQAKVD